MKFKIGDRVKLTKVKDIDYCANVYVSCRGKKCEFVDGDRCIMRKDEIFIVNKTKKSFDGDELIRLNVKIECSYDKDIWWIAKVFKKVDENWILIKRK